MYTFGFVESEEFDEIGKVVLTFVARGQDDEEC